jgi:hypothetical protein
MCVCIYIHTHIHIFTCIHVLGGNVLRRRVSVAAANGQVRDSHFPSQCVGGRRSVVFERERERKRRRRGMPVSGIYYRIINTCSIQIQNNHN